MQSPVSKAAVWKIYIITFTFHLQWGEGWLIMPLPVMEC